MFSPTCLVHCLSGQSSYYDLTVPTASGDAFSLSQALNNWYQAKQPTHVISPCTGWKCTQACGVSTYGAAEPCNMGSDGCEAVVLATPQTISEPQPATSDATPVMPGTPAPPLGSGETIGEMHEGVAGQQASPVDGDGGSGLSPYQMAAVRGQAPAGQGTFYAGRRLLASA